MSKSDGLGPRYKQPSGVGVHVDISTQRQEGVNRIIIHSKLSTALPGVTLADVGQDTGLQRMIKSEEEIAVTKISAAAADIGGEACRAALQREGVMEWEVGI